MPAAVHDTFNDHVLHFIQARSKQSLVMARSCSKAIIGRQAITPLLAQPERFGVWGLGFRVWGLGFKLPDSGFGERGRQ
ncbi:MAG: hypothetical protein K0U55_08285 [Gammaproteobacteria bacterium]|nr:hypothetical protein [Gammaproteobacteria bacterium]